MVYCPNCGAEMPFEDAQFCMKCGQKVSAQPKEGHAGAPPTAQGTPPAPQESPAVPHNAAPSTPQNTPPAPQDTGKDDSILALIAEAQAGAAKKRAEEAVPPAQAAPAAGQHTDTFELPGLTPEPPGPAFLPPEAPGAQLPPQPHQTVPPPAPGMGSLFDTTGTLNKQPSPPTQIFSKAPRAQTPPQPAPAQPQAAPPPQPPRPAQPAPPVQPPVYAQSPPLASPPPPGGGPLPTTSPPFAPPVIPQQAQRAPAAFPTQNGPTAYPPQRAVGQPALFGADAPRQNYPAPRPVPPPMQPHGAQARVRRSGGSIAARIIVSFVIFVVVLAGVTFGLLYFFNQPSAVTDPFYEAIGNIASGEADRIAQGVDELKDMVATNKLALVGIDAATADWRALGSKFTDDAELRKWINALMANRPYDGAETFEAIGVSSVPLEIFSFWPFSYIQKYTLTLTAVDLFVPGIDAQTQVMLNGVPLTTGTMANGGMLYTGMMPGRYECTVVPPGADPAQGAPVTQDMFKVTPTNSRPGSGPNALDNTLLRATVTVENCLSDAAQLFINDAPVAVTIVNGTASIPGVALGSTIRIVATVDGAQQTASVVYQSPGATTLRFENYTPLAPPETSPPDDSSSSPDTSSSTPPEGTPTLTVSELDTIMADYYQSYLECINAQSVSGLRRTTDSNRTAMGTRITGAGNKANTFRYQSVKCDADSMKYTTASGTTAIEFTMTGRYSYTPRDNGGTYEDGSTRQSVQLIYVDGGWLVNKFEYLE